MATVMLDFVEIVDGEILCYVWSDGTVIRAIAGGQDGDGSADGGGGDGEGSDDGGAADKGSASGDDGTGEAGQDGKGGDGDWKSRSRSWERKAKAALKERDELKQAQQTAADSSKTEHELALEKARQETEQKVRGEAQAELRTERLDSTVARLAAGRFADVDDALLRIQAAIRNGDLDEEDVYDDRNRIVNDVVKGYLTTILKDKPHLAGSRKPSVNGDADAGKGGGGKPGDDADALFGALLRGEGG